MPNITLVRVDHRLIHGQVITKWLKIADAKKIIIIDDYLAEESFMVDIYKMAAPPGVEVKILNVADAAKQFESNEFANKNIFILFKNIDMAYKAYKAGVKYTDLQLGGIPNEAGKKMIFTAISLGQEEIRQLNEMNEDGVNIELHIVPEEPAMSFEAAVKKYNL